MKGVENKRISAEELAEQFPAAPLVETSFEIRFNPKLRVSAEVWRVQDRLSSEYPHFSGDIVGAYSFRSSDLRKQVGISQGSFGMSTFDYPGFKPFAAEITSKAQEFCSMFGVEVLTRVGFRFNNNLLLPDGKRLHLGELVNSYLNFDLISIEKCTQFVTEVRSAVGPHQQTVRTVLLTQPADSYVLDIDVFTDTPISPSSLGALLQELHDIAKTTFLEHIKPRLKDEFRRSQQ